MPDRALDRARPTEGRPTVVLARRRRGLLLRRGQRGRGSAPARHSTRSAPPPAPPPAAAARRTPPAQHPHVLLEGTPSMSPHLPQDLVVVGHGMVGHRLVQAAIERGLDRDPRPRRRGGGAAAGVRPGRAHLLLRGRRRGARPSSRRGSTTTRGSAAARHRGHRDRPHRGAHRGDRRRTRGLRRARAGDRLVRRSCRRCRARTCPGCFVYRTIEDLEAIRERAPGATRRRGRSAAGCSAWRPRTRWRQLGLETHVVELAPRLMAVQVDDAGGGGC